MVLSKLFLKLLHGTACECCLINLFLAFLHGAVVQKLLCKIIVKLLHGAFLQKLPYKAISQAFAWNCHAEVAFQSYSSSFCMKVSCKSCLLKLFLQLLYRTVVQKLPCVKYCSVSPGSWDVRLSNGESLGRRLSYVGRNQIRLFLVHDTAWNCRA